MVVAAWVISGTCSAHTFFTQLLVQKAEEELKRDRVRETSRMIRTMSTKEDWI
jgi:hypothetical protein